MASLPKQYPELALHLADATLQPLITSSSSQASLDALTSLAANALSSRSTARRAHLGQPQRIVVEYPDQGPVILQSFIAESEERTTPEPTTKEIVAKEEPPLASVSEPAGNATIRATWPVGQTQNDTFQHGREAAQVSQETGSSNGTGGNETQAAAREVEETGTVPMLVSVVVARSADEARGARRAASGLEDVGGQFRRSWRQEVVEEDVR